MVLQSILFFSGVVSASSIPDSAATREQDKKLDWSWFGMGTEIVFIDTARNSFGEFFFRGRLNRIDLFAVVDLREWLAAETSIMGAAGSYGLNYDRLEISRNYYFFLAAGIPKLLEKLNDNTIGLDIHTSLWNNLSLLILSPQFISNLKFHYPFYKGLFSLFIGETTDFYFHRGATYTESTVGFTARIWKFYTRLAYSYPWSPDLEAMKHPLWKFGIAYGLGKHMAPQ